VYQADTGILGELGYAVAKLLRRRHCALCDLTHQGIRPKRDFQVMCARLPVPVDLVHLNERSAEVRAASESRTPCVLAGVAGELVLLLGPRDLEACGGSVEEFETRLRAAAVDQDLVFG
jgi:hypothetical protein